MSNYKSRASKSTEFTSDDELVLLQLKTKEYLSREKDSADVSPQTFEETSISQHEEFTLNLSHTPYRWQIDALDAWRLAGYKGIVKVVTGAGKTIMALQAMEETFRKWPDLRVSIVVPTVVLLEQWYQVLVSNTNLPRSLLGRHGGGFENRFEEGKRVIIWVINSAARLLVEDVEKASVGASHFLIVDECHRSGAPEFRRIFDAKRVCMLGLSATPERDDEIVEQDSNEPLDNDNSKVLSLLEREIGPVIYELTFSQAVETGIVPKFEVINYAVDLTPQERIRYDRLSREMREVEDKLKRTDDYTWIQGRRNPTNQFALFRAMAQRAKDGRIRRKAAYYVSLATQRRRMLYKARNRTRCFQDVLERELNAGAQIIVFHEVIESINELFKQLVRQKFPVALYHSQLPDSLRDDALKLYWEKTARVIISAKALIEGYDVPSTDVGIILASTSSPRQRIQTMGRVLRRYPGKDVSRIYNIYVHESADEYIFMRQAWDQMIGAKEVSYARWRGPDVIELLEGPPYRPLPTEVEVDGNELTPNSSYPGSYDGEELSVDYQGRVFKMTASGTRQYAVGTDIGKQILEVKGAAGIFKITPKRGYILVRRLVGDNDWQTVFVTHLQQPLQFKTDSHEYVEYRYSQRFGGTLMLEKAGMKYIDNKSSSAKQIISTIKQLPKEKGWPLPSRIYLAHDRRKVYVRDPEGRLVSLCYLEEPFKIKITKEGKDDGIN